MGLRKCVDFGKAGTAVVEICARETDNEAMRFRADAIKEVCRQIFCRGGFRVAENQEKKEPPESGV